MFYCQLFIGNNQENKKVPYIKLSNRTKAIFFTILAGALWGTSFPIIKIGLETIDPFTFVFWRFLVSAATIVIIMLILGKMQFKLTNKKLFIFLGIANGAGYLLQYFGMPYTTSAKAALFINLSAIWTAILSPKLLGEGFSTKKVAGVLFGLAGIVFVSTNLDFSSIGGFQLFGDSLLIISGVTWALFMIYNKKMVMGTTSATFQNMSWVLVFTFLSIAPFAVLAGPGFFSLSAWGWGAVVWTAIICWIIPYYLWLEGLKHLSASVSTVLLLSEIVVAVILSIVLLNEPITAISTIGAFLIVIAIALVSVQDKKLTLRK
jgi:drug/metabolite transporter (DMT)-like permease